ncbi:MAG: flagellar motor protein MotB [Roseburia sp.]
MAKKKQEEAPKGSPAWMATFSDLMNLLLCFFVLLFSMSTVDAEKFEQVVASLQSSFSILPSGGSSIGEGQMISSGVSQLEMLDAYYHQMANSESDTDLEGSEGEVDVEEAYKQEALAESEQMAEEIENVIEQYGIQDQVEVDFNAEYVCLDLNGTLLFDSGKSELKTEAYALLDKIGVILQTYSNNMIEIEGHTDNVPISSAKYESNDVLSMYRALTVADYVREITELNPAHIKSSGRGEYAPVADNSTAEGRARNRRVEVKIYNSYSSDLDE